MTTAPAAPTPSCPGSSGASTPSAVTAAALIALAERLEAADDPDRRVDAEIDCAVRFRHLRPAEPDDFLGEYGHSPGHIRTATGFLMAHLYSRSLDDVAELAGDDWHAVFDEAMAAIEQDPAERRTPGRLARLACAAYLRRRAHCK